MFFIASGLRDSASQELFCWGQYISFFQLKCTIIRYMGFILVKTQLYYKKITREYLTLLYFRKFLRAFYLGVLEQIHS